jgi:hypothetical protein
VVFLTFFDEKLQTEIFTMLALPETRDHINLPHNLDVVAQSHFVSYIYNLVSRT